MLDEGSENVLYVGAIKFFHRLDSDFIFRCLCRKYQDAGVNVDARPSAHISPRCSLISARSEDAGRAPPA